MINCSSTLEDCKRDALKDSSRPLALSLIECHRQVATEILEESQKGTEVGILRYEKIQVDFTFSLKFQPESSTHWGVFVCVNSV